MSTAPATAQVAGQVADAPAVGAEPGGPADQSSQAAESAGLGDIVVTARRTEESLQQVPVAVTVISTQQLEQNQIRSLSDLQLFVPSATVSGYQNRNLENFSLRGQSETGLNAGGGAGGGPAVVGYLSEVPVPIAGPGLYYDLQSVQVLKGPQGTLFGRNTTGGAILFEPTRPGNEVDGYVQGVVGNYSRFELQAALNVPLVDDRLSIRVAGQTGRRDGYTRDVLKNVRYDNRNYSAFRVGVFAKPIDGVENYTLFNYLDYDENGPGNILIAGNPAVPSLQALFEAQRARGVRRIAVGVDQRNAGRFLNLINKTSIDLTPEITLRNIVSYSTRKTLRQDDEDGTTVPILDSPGALPGNGFQQYFRTVTEELQLQGTSFGDLLRWQVGGYFEDVRNPRPITFTTQAGSAFNVSDRIDLRTSTKGVYAQATLGLPFIVEGLSATAGYRYSWDRVFQGISTAGSASRVPAVGDPCFTRLNATFPNCYSSARSRFEGQSYTLGLDWSVNSDTLIYFVTRQGYKAGGFNIVASILDSDQNPFFAYRPERVRDVEGGVKADWNVGGVGARTNLAVYRSKYRNAQVLTAAVVAGFPQGVTVNAASATIWGVELETTFRLTPRLTLGSTYSYLDAGYDRYVTPLGIDLTDSPYPYAPKHKFVLTGDYKLPIESRLGELSVGTTYAYQDEVYVGIGQFGIGSPVNVQPGYGLLNLRADLRQVAGTRADLSFFATNVTNKKYRVTGFDAYNITGTSVAVFGEPRFYGVRLTYPIGDPQ